MDYPFSHFVRHLQQWPKFVGITDVVTAPEKSKVPVHIGPDTSTQSVHMRFRHMLALEGCTQAERDYRMPRYFVMNAFIQAHESEFRRAGFVLINDGIGGSVPFSILRAVHEVFRGEPLRGFDAEPSKPVIARAVKYNTMKGWLYE